MFYGASKNKNGKEISDYDKYKPWNLQEFSGKIKYTLDNGKEFEVFRDFNKKNARIYNENLEEISDYFNIDKTNGNQFFKEQTGVDENIFFNTTAVYQTEVVLDKSEQNTLIQKIANVVSSGDDNVSYKKAIDKLNKKLIDEVGTARTSEKPINIVEDEIENIEDEKQELNIYKTQLQVIDEEMNEIKNEVKKMQNQLSILKKIKDNKQVEILEEQRIGINSNKLHEYNDKLYELKKSNLKKNKINKKSINPIIALAIWVIITIASILLKNISISVIIGCILAIFFLINLWEYSNYKKKINYQNEQKIKNDREIEFLQEAINQCSGEIQKDREKIEQNQIEQKQHIINEYGNILNLDEYILEDLEEITKNIEEMQNKYNEIILHENTICIEKNNITQKLEKLVKNEERLQYLYKQKAELEKLANTINLAQEGLEEAYTIMKKTITPKFTNNLTSIIKNITNEKYKKVGFNDNDGLTIELENGEYVNCSKLSIGTIDQMYLALRLSILNEITNETMPIILDEAFVYYDKNRLENILSYISKQYTNRQIIILTCTNRETEALNNLNLKYNLINL